MLVYNLYIAQDLFARNDSAQTVYSWGNML